MKIKADLHQYFLIGFHDFWIKEQIGNLERNLLELMIRECSLNEINMCAITSQYEKDQNDKTKEQINTEDFGLIHDRFGYLVKESERFEEKYGYSYNIEVDKGNTLMRIINNLTGKGLIILNSQIVGAKINGKRVDTLVIGGNRIPNDMDLEETLKYTDKKGFINLTKNIGNSRSFPVSEEAIGEYLNYYDGFGCDAQKMIPRWVGKIPIIGKKFNDVLRLSEEELTLYKKFDKPLVPFSSSHYPTCIGDASIEFYAHDFFNKSADNILSELKERISEKKVRPNLGYTSASDLWKVNSIFSKGVKVYLGQGEKDLGNDNLYLKGFK